MKNLAIAVILLAVLCATPILAADSIGKIVALEGTATATDASGTERVLEIRSPIYQNDKITTGIESKLQIMFDDDSVISQGERSEITIDEYVYSPEQEEEVSATVRIARGLFRVVTGKITDLNPERFSVRTRQATIGIRGCDLGFRDNGDVVDVLILHLPEGKEILIEKNAREGSSKWPESLTVVEGGVAVSVGADMNLSERPMTAFEAAEFFELLAAGAPVASADDSPTELGSKGSVAMDVTRTADDRSGGVDALAGAASQTEASGDVQEESDNKKEEIELAQAPVHVPAASDLPPVDDKPKTDPKKMDGPTEAPPELPDEPPPPPPEHVAGQAGTHWQWDMWSDASMRIDLTPAPPPDFPGSGGSYFTDADFQFIVDNVSPTYLTGSGRAGAMVDHEGLLRKLEGTCDLTIDIPGSSATPTWNGTFALDNVPDDRTDTLDWTAEGTIGTGGILSGGQTSYELVVDGQTYDAASITGESMTGALVGADPSPTAITGVGGQWAFQHGDGTRVDSVFGADVR